MNKDISDIGLVGLEALPQPTASQVPTGICKEEYDLLKSIATHVEVALDYGFRSQYHELSESIRVWKEWKREHGI